MKKHIVPFLLALPVLGQVTIPLPVPVVQSNVFTHINIQHVEFPSKLTNPNAPVVVRANAIIRKEARVGESEGRGEIMYDFNIVLPQSNVVAQIRQNAISPPTGPITNVLNVLQIEATSQEGAVVMLGLEKGTDLVEALQRQ